MDLPSVESERRSDMMSEEKRQNPQNPQEGVTLSADNAYYCQHDCYRMRSLLRQAENLVESLPIQTEDEDRENAEDAKLLIQSAMILLGHVTRRIEIAVGFRREDDLDDPSDL